MLDRLKIRLDDESSCVTYELADETGVVVECGTIPQTEFNAIRSQLISGLAAKGDTKLDVIDYLAILFVLLETNL